MRHRYYRSSGGISIVGILIFFLLTYLLLRLIGGLYSFLWGLIPFMLIISIVVNRHVVTDYVTSIARSFDKGLWHGLGRVALTGIGLPFVSLYLVFKSFQTRGQRDSMPRSKGDDDYIPFEEIEETDAGDDEYLDLPPLEKQYDRRYTDRS